MELNWEEVWQELFHYHDLKSLSPLALDTLYGAMWSLDPHPSKTFCLTLTDVMRNNGEALLQYSMKCLQKLIEEPGPSFRPLPSKRCSCIGLGTFGWKYNPEIIHYALENGIGLIDTAEGYGYGRVEVELGKALRGWETFYSHITTKVRRDHMSSNALPKAVDRSIRKLGGNPHMQIHYFNPKFPEAIKHLSTLRSRGLIRSIGVGNCSVCMIEQWQQVLSEFSGEVLYSVQVPFNLSDQRIKQALLPYCQERGILVLAYSPLGQNFKSLYKPILGQVAKKYKATSAQIALAWLLGHPGVMPIPRTNEMEHLRQNMEAVSIMLSEEDMKALEEDYES